MMADRQRKQCGACRQERVPVRMCDTSSCCGRREGESTATIGGPAHLRSMRPGSYHRPNTTRPRDTTFGSESLKVRGTFCTSGSMEVSSRISCRCAQSSGTTPPARKRRTRPRSSLGDRPPRNTLFRIQAAAVGLALLLALPGGPSLAAASATDGRSGTSPAQTYEQRTQDQAADENLPDRSLLTDIGYMLQARTHPHPEPTPEPTIAATTSAPSSPPTAAPPSSEDGGLESRQEVGDHGQPLPRNDGTGNPDDAVFTDNRHIDSTPVTGTNGTGPRTGNGPIVFETESPTVVDFGTPITNTDDDTFMTPLTDSPTVRPTARPTVATDEPTKSPTRNPTPVPTAKPTPYPTTRPTTAPPTSKPTENPTRKPQLEPTTPYPTRTPTNAPTARPTTPRPTGAPVTIVPTTPDPTRLPTNPPTRFPTTSPTQEPTIPEQQFLVELEFYFDDLERLEDSSTILWEEVTAEQIYDHLYWTSEAIGMEEFMELEVNTRIRRQIQGLPDPSMGPIQVATDRADRGNGRTRKTLRQLQIQIDEKDSSDDGSGRNADDATPLTIITVNVIKFKSNREYEQAVIDDHVGKAFNSDSDREKYIADLQATNDRSFRSIEYVTVMMNGTPVPEAPTPAPMLGGGGGDDGPDGSTVPAPQSSSGMSIWLIVGPLIGGVLVVAAMVILIYSRQQSKRKKAFMSKAYDATRVSKFVAVDTSNDDVSTLGDPVFSSGAMFTNTAIRDAAENSLASGADYEYARAFGARGDAPTASTPKSDEASRSAASASKTLSTGITGIGTKMGMSLFQDDASFEKQYCEAEERIEVEAPAGKLGVVIDTPVGGVPIVHAIKDTSVLADTVYVGDQLISVDDVDCTQLSAIEVSKLISSRANNPSRILVFVRLRTSEQ